MTIRGAIALGALVLIAASCGGTTKQDVLRVLFDDPPAPDAPDRPDSVATIRAESAPEGEPPATVETAPLVMHSPYEEKACDECHDLDASLSFDGTTGGAAAPKTGSIGSRLRFPVGTLCVECHDDMTEEALEEESEFLHAPASDGECLECHDPHASRFASLLRGPVETVCFECHDAEEVLEAEHHAVATPEEQRCVRCHDPHASDREYLLTAAATGGAE